MNKVKKNKIIKYGGASILVGAYFAYSGIKLYDFTIDHLHEYCPLNDYFGINHQLNVINNDKSNPRYKAYYFENGKGKIYSDYTDEYIPEGFEIEGNRAYKEVSIGHSDLIVITDNTVVIPNDSDNNKYYDPKVVSGIKVNK